MNKVDIGLEVFPFLGDEGASGFMARVILGSKIVENAKLQGIEYLPPELINLTRVAEHADFEPFFQEGMDPYEADSIFVATLVLAGLASKSLVELITSESN